MVLFPPPPWPRHPTHRPRLLPLGTPSFLSSTERRGHLMRHTAHSRCHHRCRCSRITARKKMTPRTESGLCLCVSSSSSWPREASDPSAPWPGKGGKGTLPLHRPPGAVPTCPSTRSQVPAEACGRHGDTDSGAPVSRPGSLLRLPLPHTGPPPSDAQFPQVLQLLLPPKLGKGVKWHTASF